MRVFPGTKMWVSRGKGVTWINQRNRESRGITCSSNSSSMVSLFTEIGSINVIQVSTNSGPIPYRSTRVVGEEFFFKNFRADLSLKFNDLTDSYLNHISYQWSLVWIKFRIWLFKWQRLMTIALMKWQLVLSSHGELALKKNFDIVQNSIWLKKNRARDNEGKFHSFLMCRIWIYSQRLIS